MHCSFDDLGCSEAQSTAPMSTCVAEGLFGAFPNCEGLAPSLFLNIVYGVGLLQAAQLISDGSELLLEILSPDWSGGLLLPVLGAVPDAAVIVASGLGASKEAAQEQVSVGMGTLAGSTVMLSPSLGAVPVGRPCDLDAFTGKAIPKTLSHGPYASLSMTGVTTDEDTRLNAKVMMVSCLLFLIVQVPALFGDADDPDWTAAASRAPLLAGTAPSRCSTPSFSAEDGRARLDARRVRSPWRTIGLSMGGILVDGTLTPPRLTVSLTSSTRR